MAASPGPATAQNVFSGYVRRCPSTTTGIAGVTVRLLRDVDPDGWTQVDSAVTNASGYYELRHTPEYALESYRIVETDLGGYSSCNAVPGPGGTKVNNNAIQYSDLWSIDTYSDNVFYDETPNDPPRADPVQRARRSLSRSR